MNCNWIINQTNHFSTHFYSSTFVASGHFLKKQFDCVLGNVCVTIYYLLFSLVNVWYLDIFQDVLEQPVFMISLTKEEKSNPPCILSAVIWCFPTCHPKIMWIWTLYQERRMMETFPYLLNINEDPQLSGVLKHFIQDGTLLYLLHILALRAARIYIARRNASFCTL